MKFNVTSSCSRCYELSIYDNTSGCLLLYEAATSLVAATRLMCYLEGEFYECGFLDAQFIEVPLQNFRTSSFCSDMTGAELREIARVWVCAVRGRLLVLRHRLPGQGVA